MSNADFVTKKLEYYIKNFDDLTNEEIKQSQYLILHKANEHMNRYYELVKEVQEQNRKLIKQIKHYESFIKDSGLTKRFELYSKGKGVI